MSGSGDLLTLSKMLTLRRNDGLSELEAMRKIVEAWRSGRLELTAEHHEMTEQPNKPARKVLEPGTEFSEPWDWHSSRALGKIDNAVVDFRQIAATRADFEATFNPKSKGGRPPVKGVDDVIKDRLSQSPSIGTKALASWATLGLPPKH